MTLKKTGITILITGMILGLAGCGVSSESESTKESLQTFTAAGEIKEEQPDIYVITKVRESQYWEKIQQGAVKAGEETGCNVYVASGNSEADVQGQISLLKTAADSGADAVLIAPNDSEALADPVKAVRDKGIPIVLVDTIINTDDFDICYMTDNMEAGKMAAKEMLALLKQAGASENEKAGVAIQVGSVHSQTVIDRLAGFNAYWAVNAPAKWKILDDIKCSDGEVEKAKKMAGMVLDDYPELRGIYGCSDIPTVGIATELQSRGRNDVVMVGFDYSDVTAELVASNDYLGATMIQQQFQMGYQGLKSALDLINGRIPEKKFVDTGVFIVDRTNVVAEEVRRILIE